MPYVMILICILAAAVLASVGIFIFAGHFCYGLPIRKTVLLILAAPFVLGSAYLMFFIENGYFGGMSLFGAVFLRCLCLSFPHAS